MMPTDKPQDTWIVDDVAVPLRAPCLCGATLASHLQRAPHPCPRRRCASFRPSHAGAVVRGLKAAS